MMKANFGNEEAKRELVQIYEQKIGANNIWLIILAIIFAMRLNYRFGAGVLYWLAAAYVLGNRICLKNQLKRIRKIGETRAQL